MCEIAGIYNFGNNKPVEKVVVQKMGNVIRHRGSDAEGLFAQGNIGLGGNEAACHHRLQNVIGNRGWCTRSLSVLKSLPTYSSSLVPATTFSINSHALKKSLACSR